MNINALENQVVIGSKEYTYDYVIDNLANLSGKQISDFFLNREVKMPRALNMLALRSVLNDQVKISKQLVLTDEMRYRLLSYNSFSEYQLQNFMATIVNDTLFGQYVKNLWKLILANADELKLVESELSYLLTLKKEQLNNDFNSYEVLINPAFVDFDEEFDGLGYDTFQSTLVKSSTITELREIGAKYNLNIPRRLKREELEKLICERLEEENKLDEETKAKLDLMPVLMLQRFAKINGIKLSVELKKDELVDFIIRAAKKANLLKCKMVSLNQIPENEFEFKEEYVKDVIVQAEEPVQKEAIEPEAVIARVEPTVEEKTAEPAIEEAPIKESFSINEDDLKALVEKVVLETLASKNLTDTNTVNKIVEEKVNSAKLNNVNDEEIEKLINQKVIDTNNFATKDDLSNEQEKVLELVNERISKISPTQTLSKEELSQIVDEKIKENSFDALNKSKEEIKAYVLANVPHNEVVNHEAIDTDTIVQAIRATIHEMMPATTAKYEMAHKDVTINDETLENKNYDEEIANECFQNDKPKFEDKNVSDEVVLSKQMQKRKAHLERKNAKKNQKKSIKNIKKDVKRISKKGLANNEDGQTIENYLYLMQAREIEKQRRASKRHRIIGTIFLILLLAFIFLYVTFVIYAKNAAAPFFSNIVSFFDSKLKGFSDFMKKIAEPVAKMIK